MRLDAGFDNPEKRAARDEDELCESIAAKFIYLPELLSYIVGGRNIKNYGSWLHAKPLETSGNALPEVFVL
ncbi:hypothetical protein [Bradyrhizobium sp. CCBAU 11361]|uniref:hypothetical protein n=1 Tax=Bradyrhizobium sp. CCBAU 11361 TaxID=1630812 RepID=UPI002302EA38|nr:hypothetical protein [Bradyrhizobium sp. CCBAU 11361]